MARKFITTREIELIDFWNKELIQDVVDQSIIYYAISYEDSVVHDVYDEAVQKSWATPVRVNARVKFEQNATNTLGAGLDSTYSLDVSLHADELRDRNLKPREGDFIEYGQIFFEVTSVAFTQPVFGQINDKINVKLTCIPSREGQFSAGGMAQEGLDNSHPVEPAPPRTLGDDL